MWAPGSLRGACVYDAVCIAVFVRRWGALWGRGRSGDVIPLAVSRNQIPL